MHVLLAITISQIVQVQSINMIIFCRNDFNLYASDKAPSRMKLTLNGNVWDENYLVSGTYILQSGTKNGKNYWLHRSGRFALWWGSNGYWWIGNEENKGWNRGSLHGPSNNDNWPIFITKAWKYLKDSNFHTARNGEIEFNYYPIDKSK